MNKIVLVCLILVAVTIEIDGQNFTLTLWDKSNDFVIREETDSEVWDDQDILRVKNVSDPNIAVFLPSKKLATGKAVIICPGGGYKHLAYDWEGTDVAKWLNSKGIAGIVLKYRLPDGTDSLWPLIDAKRAMRVVRHYAEGWSIDPSKIGIIGFSAGGHLASMMGTLFDNGNLEAPDQIEKYSSRPDFMILVYPVISMCKGFCHTGSRRNLLGDTVSEDRAKQFSSQYQIKEDTPPTFIVHAMDDIGVSVKNSLSIFETLSNKCISVEMHIFPHGGHGFSLGRGTGTLSGWPELCYQWMKQF
jgi:acetyl esterase/lipase